MNPQAAGMKASLPSFSSDLLIAGKSRLHTLAAVMTPAAKPVNMQMTALSKFFFIRKTHAAPSIVPRKGIRTPFKISDIAELLSKLFSFL